jgi:uncharacterized membrane protein
MTGLESAAVVAFAGLCIVAVYVAFVLYFDARR